MNSHEEKPLHEERQTFGDLANKNNVSANDLIASFKSCAQLGGKIPMKSFYQIVGRIQLTESNLSEIIACAEKAMQINKKNQYISIEAATEIEDRYKEIITYFQLKIKMEQQ